MEAGSIPVGGFLVYKRVPTTECNSVRVEEMGIKIKGHQRRKKKCGFVSFN